MIYYFVSPDGDYVETEEAPRGYFDPTVATDMRTSKREARAEQKRRLKARIAELRQVLKEVES